MATEILSLGEIFEKTDTISCGPFKLVKDVGADFKDARFWVNDILIPLTPTQKKIMALLISQDENKVTSSMLSAALDTPKYQAIGSELPDEELRPKAAFNVDNTFSVHISQIRKTIINADGEDIKDIAKMIRSIRKQGSRALVAARAETGYRLDLGE